MIYFCCQERRRDAVASQSTLNGIDFLEVLDDPSVPPIQRQRTLFVHFINALAPASLTASKLRIDGGERITNIQITGAAIGSGPQANLLTVTVAARGRFFHLHAPIGRRFAGKFAATDGLRPSPLGHRLLFQGGLSE